MGQKFLLLCLVAAFFPSTARSEVNLNVQIGVPVAPPMVMVQPGVRVVEDSDQEIFYHQRYWWLRQDDGHWYRARDRRGGWMVMEDRAVPAPLYRLPPGHYKHWRKEERKEARHEEKRERKEWKHGREGGDRDGEHGGDDRGGKHGHGHGHEGRD